MLQRTLGKDGPAVGAIGVGAMPFSVLGSRPTFNESKQVLFAAVERGMTLWDTADAYCVDDTEFGHNELLIGQTLRELPAEYRSQVLVATKGGHIRPRGSWDVDGRPEYLREAVKGSLKRLGVDQIDLYQFHRPDPKVPFEDSIGALAEIYQAGEAKYIGLSNVTPQMIDIAVKAVPIASVQNQYSPVHLAPETDGVLEKCKSLGIAFLPYSPLGGMGGAKGIGTSGVLAEIASEIKVSPQRVVLAWLLTKYLHIIPIPGASRLQSIEDNSQADNVVLSDVQIKRLQDSWGSKPTL